MVCFNDSECARYALARQVLSHNLLGGDDGGCGLGRRLGGLDRSAACLVETDACNAELDGVFEAFGGNLGGNRKSIRLGSLGGLLLGKDGNCGPLLSKSIDPLVGRLVIRKNRDVDLVYVVLYGIDDARGIGGEDALREIRYCLAEHVTTTLCGLMANLGKVGNLDLQVAHGATPDGGYRSIP